MAASHAKVRAVIGCALIAFALGCGQAGALEHSYRSSTTDLDSRLAPLVGQNVGAVLVRLGEPELIGVGTSEDPFNFGMRQVHYIWGMAGCNVLIDVNPVTHVVTSFEWSEMGYLCQHYAAQLDGKDGVL